MADGTPPAVWSRRQVADAVGVPATTVREWERAGWCAPSVRAARAGETRRNLYGSVDVACAAVVRDLRAAGVSGRPVSLATAALAGAAPPPGWSGWVLVDVSAGRTMLLHTADAVSDVAAALDGVVVAVPVRIPSGAGR